MHNSTLEEVQGVVCSWIAKAMPSETKQVFTWYFATAIVNIFLAITALCGNILILIAFQKAPFTLPAPSRVLFRSLATSDLCVGLISQPLFVATIFLIGYEGRWNVCRLMRYLTFVASATLCGVSLLTLTAISVDRLLVLLLRFKYRTIVTRGRIKAVVGCFWITSLATSIVYLKSRRVFFVVTAVVIMLSIVTSAFSYFIIFFIVHRRQNRIEDNGRQVHRLNSNRLLRFQKTVYSALWVHFALVVCYLPFSVIEVMAANIGISRRRFIAGTCLATLIYLNSTINPFLYCWRIREVKQAVKQIVGL